jgi:hypothetical protein
MNRHAADGAAAFIGCNNTPLDPSAGGDGTAPESLNRDDPSNNNGEYAGKYRNQALLLPAI